MVNENWAWNVVKQNDSGKCILPQVSFVHWRVFDFGDW
jgi:hypothetical protein